MNRRLAPVPVPRGNANGLTLPRNYSLTTTMDKAKTFVQAVLLIWVLAASALLFVSARTVMNETERTTEVEGVPRVPQVPTGDAVPKEKIEAVYKLQVDAYTQEVTAYKLRVEAQKGMNAVPTRKDRFTAVFKETIAELLKTILASLVAFAFVKVGGTVVSNALRKDATPQRISLFD